MRKSFIFTAIGLLPIIALAVISATTAHQPSIGPAVAAPAAPPQAAFGGPADLKLTAVHPDENPDHTYGERFSLENSLESLRHLDQSLDSFTELAQQHYDRARSTGAGPLPFTDPESLFLAIPNSLGAVEGTLRKQNYEIARLRFELAQRRHAAGEINRPQLDQARAELETATRDFQKFWNDFTIAD